MKKNTIFLIFLIAHIAVLWFAERAFADLEQGINFFKERAYNDAFKILSNYSNYPEAKYYLGVILMGGLAGKLDQKQAIEFLQEAANGGFAKAQLYLGYLYETGRGVPKNIEIAISLYKRAAESGNVRAQFNLALVYRNGKGVERDNRLAVKWFEAAANCLLSAKTNLAYMLEVGLGTEKNITRAIELYTEAAIANYAPAQYNLAVAYLTGDGVEQDFVQAYKWFELAARNQQQKEKARERQDILTKFMEPEEIKKAKELIKNFAPSQTPKCSRN